MKIVLLLLTFISLLLRDVSGQDKILYFTDNNLSSIDLNPASVKYFGDGYFSMPGFGSVSLSTTTSGFSYDDLITEDVDVSFNQALDFDRSVVKDILEKIDWDQIYEELESVNFIKVNGDISIINFGFKIDDLSISIGSSANFKFATSFNEDLVKILDESNWSDGGAVLEEEIVGDIELRSSGLSELGVSAAYKIDEKWSVGVGAKLLLGASGFESDNLKYKVYTPEGTSFSVMSAEGEMALYGPVTIVTDDDGKIDDISFNNTVYLSDMLKNRGLTFGFGATYKIGDNIEVGAAVTDLGFMNWTSSVTVLKGEGVVKFEGVEDIVDLSGFLVVDTDQDSYRSKFSGDMTITGEYLFTEFLSAGLLINRELKDVSPITSATISANYHLKSTLSASLGYTAKSESLGNLGLGFNIDLAPVQFQIATDNLITIFNPKGGQSADLMFGLNFFIGSRADRARQARL